MTLKNFLQKAATCRYLEGGRLMKAQLYFIRLSTVCFLFNQARVRTLSFKGLCDLLGVRRVHKSVGPWLQGEPTTPKFCSSRKRTHEGPYLV